MTQDLHVSSCSTTVGFYSSEMKEGEEGTSPSSSCSLVQASTLITSLLSSSCSIRTFTGKWRLIRDGLEKLSSSLNAVETACKEIRGLDELLRALTATVEQTQLLADQCCNESYPGGKLRLRSDLDMIISKLGLHIRQLDEIYASGSLTHARAIVLFKPAAGATHEDMRLYAKDLLSRLRVGGSEFRARALASLNEILAEDEKYVRIMMAESDDSVGLLIDLLESDETGNQEEASRAVSVIAGFDSFRGILNTAGVVRPLIRVLETGSQLGKERAARALKRMTENSDNSWSVSGQGGVTTLLKICSSRSSGAELVSSACAVLRNICGVSEIKRFMMDEGAISVFAKLVKSREEVIQIQAVEVLATLASDDEAIKQRLIRERVIESLVHLLDPNSSFYSAKTREVVLRAIERCCFSSPNSVKVLMRSGYIDRLLFIMRNGEVPVQESALKAASRLCGVSEEAKRLMGDLGFMTELVKLLDMRSIEVRELAAEALCSLISVRRNRRKFVQDDHDVNRILQLLDPQQEKPVAMKRLLLSALLALTNSNSGRRKMVASTYVGNIKKLAENDVWEAKKIIKKLSGNKFRAILKRIWSF